jgi:hypothetical protein
MMPHQFNKDQTGLLEVFIEINLKTSATIQTDLTRAKLRNTSVYTKLNPK